MNGRDGFIGPARANYQTRAIGSLPAEGIETAARAVGGAVGRSAAAFLALAAAAGAARQGDRRAVAQAIAAVGDHLLAHRQARSDGGGFAARRPGLDRPLLHGLVG